MFYTHILVWFGFNVRRFGGAKNKKLEKSKIKWGKYCDDKSRLER